MQPPMLMSMPDGIPDYIHQSVRALPVLPTAVTRLLSLTREVDVDFKEIARVIESDQTLTARVLRAWMEEALKTPVAQGGG